MATSGRNMSVAQHPLGDDTRSAQKLSDEGIAFRCRALTVDLGIANFKRRIIENLQLEVMHRQFVCILGESGVGKTTLLRVFGGLVPAATGSVLELNGERISGPPQGAVFVFQNY